MFLAIAAGAARDHPRRAESGIAAAAPGSRHPHATAAADRSCAVAAICQADARAAGVRREKPASLPKPTTFIAARRHPGGEPKLAACR